MPYALHDHLPGTDYRGLQLLGSRVYPILSTVEPHLLVGYVAVYLLLYINPTSSDSEKAVETAIAYDFRYCLPVLEIV